MSAMILLLLAPALAKAGSVPVGRTSGVRLMNGADVASYRDYPASALEVGVEARVRVKVSVDKAGRVQGCVGDTLTKLDDLALADKFVRVTCRLIGARAQFVAGRDEAGQAKGGLSHQTFAWRIEEDPKHVVASYAARIRFSLSAQGVPVGCNLSTSLPDVDTAAWCRAFLATIPAEIAAAQQGAVRAVVSEMRVAYGDTLMPPSSLPSRHGQLGQGRASFTLLPGRGIVSCVVEDQSSGAEPCEAAKADLGIADTVTSSRLRAGRLEFRVWEEVK